MIRLIARMPDLVKTKKFRIKFKLPINKISRLAIDEEVERLRHSVIPIIGDDHGRPILIGSAVAVKFRGYSFLITALHVREHEIKALYYFGSDRRARPFSGTFHISKINDLAVKQLDETELSALDHVPFLAESDFATDQDVQGQIYASVVGYPATAARRVDKMTIDTPKEAVGGVATSEPDGTIHVYFNKKEGAYGIKGHIDPRDQNGKSGGAIFSMRTTNGNILPHQQAKLVGIGIEWRKDEKRIVGTGMAAVKTLLIGSLDSTERMYVLVA